MKLQFRKSEKCCCHYSYKHSLGGVVPVRVPSMDQIDPFVAEPISTSTPQMSYTVKRVNENSQNTMKGQKGEITIITRDNLFVVFTSVYVNVRGGCM